MVCPDSIDLGFHGILGFKFLKDNQADISFSQELISLGNLTFKMRISPHEEIQVVKPLDKVFQSKYQRSPKINSHKPTFKPIRSETNNNYIPLSNTFSPLMHLEQHSDVSPASPVKTQSQIKYPRRKANSAQPRATSNIQQVSQARLEQKNQKSEETPIPLLRIPRAILLPPSSELIVLGHVRRNLNMTAVLEPLSVPHEGVAIASALVQFDDSRKAPIKLLNLSQFPIEIPKNTPLAEVHKAIYESKPSQIKHVHPVKHIYASREEDPLCIQNFM